MAEPIMEYMNLLAQLSSSGRDVAALRKDLKEAKRLLKKARWIGYPVAYVEDLSKEIDVFLAEQKGGENGCL